MTDEELKKEISAAQGVLRPRRVGAKLAYVCLGGSVSVFEGDTWSTPEAVAETLNSLSSLLAEMERRL